MSISAALTALETALAAYDAANRGSVNSIVTELSNIKGSLGDTLFISQTNTGMALVAAELLTRFQLVNTDSDMTTAIGNTIYLILDNRTGNVSKYINNAWTIVGNISDPSVLPRGRLYKDMLAFKSFYLGLDGVLVTMGGPGML